MTLEHTTIFSPQNPRLRCVSLLACPQCGETVVAPEASEFLSEGKVRHFWSCEACGQDFQTSVRLAD